MTQVHELQQFMLQLPKKLELLISSVMLHLLEDPASGWRDPVLRQAGKLAAQLFKLKDDCNIAKILEDGRKANELSVREHEVLLLSRDPRAQDTFWNAFKREKSKIAQAGRDACHIVLGLQFNTYQKLFESEEDVEDEDTVIHPLLADVLATRGFTAVRLTVVAVCRPDLVKVADIYKKASGDVKKSRKQKSAKPNADDNEESEAIPSDSSDENEMTLEQLLNGGKMPRFDGQAEFDVLKTFAQLGKVTISNAAYAALAVRIFGLVFAFSLDFARFSSGLVTLIRF